MNLLHPFGMGRNATLIGLVSIRVYLTNYFKSRANPLKYWIVKSGIFLSCKRLLACFRFRAGISSTMKQQLCNSFMPVRSSGCLCSCLSHYTCAVTSDCRACNVQGAASPLTDEKGILYNAWIYLVSRF